MHLKTRKIIDKSFSGLGFVSIFLMALSLVVIFAPIAYKGLGAFFFQGTVEFRKLEFEKFDRGSKEGVTAETNETAKFREPVYQYLADYETELNKLSFIKRMKKKKELKEVKEYIHELLGPAPGEKTPVMVRERYGQVRWDRAEVKIHEILFKESWNYSDTTKMGVKVYLPRVEDFKGTTLEPMFGYIEKNADKMLNPSFTFYWRFLTDKSFDSHMFGGIWSEMLGTFYLALLAMIFAVPLGVIAAIFLTEYAGEGKIISFLRICISTLAGVPSIVFGLFGLAFFINTLEVSDSKSVLAGSLTLSLLILPTIIRASEEAIMAVPRSYKEASMSLGSSKWNTIVSVILPAALPGILTGIVISMGRAAGETAPIIFTAAVSVGKPLQFLEIFNQPTPALSWNIYNLCTEHEAVDEIRHVQFGMVLTLVLLVLLLNLGAIILRAKISKKLRG